MTDTLFPMPKKPTCPPRGLQVAWVKALRPGPVAYEVADSACPGLVLRVTPKGARSFRWYVRSLGKVVTIGPWSERPNTPAHVSIDEARTWLGRLKMARKAGLAELEATEAELKRHLAPRAAPPAPAASGPTVDHVAEGFLKQLERQRKRPDDARYVVEKDILPVIGSLPLAELRKAHCRNVVERVVERGAPVQAGKVLGLLKQLLDYAENVEEDFTNPAARLKAANLGVENNIRDRWLGEKEIPLLWNALDWKPDDAAGSKLPTTRTKLALRLLLLTAVRSAELRLARWEDVDLEAGLWTIPVANQKLTLKQAKQARPFVIPLSPTARGLFEELRQLAELERVATESAEVSPWVLAGRSEAGCYTDKALGRAMRRLWRAHPKLKDIPEASPHDLRRTARTWLGKLGIPPHICERCLNHSFGRIARTYDHGDYLPERRAALEKWDAFVQRIVEPQSSNVTFLAVGQ